MLPTARMSSLTSCQAYSYGNDPEPKLLDSIQPFASDSQKMTHQETYLVGNWNRNGTRINVQVNVSQQLLHGQIACSTGDILLNPAQIKCGIYTIVPHRVFIEKIYKFQNEIADHIAAFYYPDGKEIWIFAARKTAAIWIQEAKKIMYEVNLGKYPSSIQGHSDALKHLQTALKTQKQQNGDIEELKQTIQKIENERFIKSIDIDLSIYLSQQEIVKFNRIITSIRTSCETEEDISPYLIDYIESLEQSSLEPYQHYLSGWIYNNIKDRYHLLKAVHHYKELAKQNRNPASCLKKIQLLLEKEKSIFLDILESLDHRWLLDRRNETNDIFLETLVLQKDIIRMVFEQHLKILSSSTKQAKPLTCFICYNVDEADIGKWLEHVLTPDLQKMNVEVIACFKDFGPGKRIIGFEKKIVETDLAIIACTPEVKKKCIARENAPYGIAQEIQLAELRINDEKKHEKTFFLYFKGTREDSRPSIVFKDYLHITLNKEDIEGVYSYYEKAFEFFGSMLDVDREISRRVKEAFSIAVHKTLDGNINIFELEVWRRNRDICQLNGKGTLK